MTDLKLKNEESYIEKLSERIAMRLCDKEDKIEYLKIKLGVELILVNVGKGIIVYLIAIIFRTVLPTIITHLAYTALRKFSKGLHAKSSIVCIMTSVMLFVIFPYLMQNIILDRWWVFLIGIITTYLLYKYAPADTEKSPIIEKDKRKLLKWQSIGMNIILLCVALTTLLPPLRTLIMLGGGVQVIMVLPITYKILGRSYNNYETYET